MTRLCLALTCALLTGVLLGNAAEPTKPGKVDIGQKAPAFRIKDASGKQIDLAKLTEQGPVLVRLTCGCSGCDKELAYFQKIHEAYKDQGLRSLLIFKEPDAKMVKYAQDKKLNMLYAVDPKGASWTVFQTKAMPANFLIAKGGKIVAIATGCDPSGLLANKVSQQAAKTLGQKAIDVKKEVEKTKPKK
jgi:peroxiredoxin